MFDADEQLHDITQVGKTTVNAVRTGIQLIQQLRNLSESEIAKLAVNDTNFQFTGQVTDLRFFSGHAVMDMDMIRNIPDAELRTAVQDEFNRAAQNGLIKINPQTNSIALTTKGQQYIGKPTFQKAAQQQLAYVQVPQEIQTVTENIGFPLNGSMNDIQIFRYADTVDLTTVLQSPNSEVAQKVIAGFQKLETEGKVAFDGLKMTLTETGKQTLASPIMQSAASSVKLVPTGEAVSTAVVVAVSAVKKTVQVISDTASQAPKVRR